MTLTVGKKSWNRISGTKPLVLAFLVSIFSATAVGQAVFPPSDPAAAPSVSQPQDKAENSDDALKKYLTLKKQIVENKSKVTKLLISTPTSDQAAQKAVLEEIETIKKDVAEWESQLSGLILEAYIQAPDQNREVAQEFLRRLNSMMGSDAVGGNFSPAEALQIIDRATAAGCKNLKVLMAGSQAAYACLEFARCREYLEAMKANGAQLNDIFLENLENARASWEIEQKSLAEDKNLPLVSIETSAGTIQVELFEDQAPQTVANFISLCESGFYTDQPFYEVRSGEAIKTGCPEGTGKGNAGYYITDESALPNARRHFGGYLSMLHNEPGQGSSQFAIAFQATPIRNGKFTVFGRVVDRMDLINKIPHFNNQLKSVRQPVKIVSTKVLQKRAHTYEFEKISVDSSPKPSVANADDGAKTTGPNKKD